MAFLPHTLSPAFDQQIVDSLGEFDPRLVAEQVLQLSGFYLANPGVPTPWSESWTTPAYIAYFLPLNFVRLKAAMREVRRFLPADSYSEIWDFGSGLGATHWVLESEPDLAPRAFFGLERSPEAILRYKELLKKASARWTMNLVNTATPGTNSLGVFSYSFLEMQQHLPKLEKFSHLLIVEPSTRGVTRDLMEWRSRFMEMGFNPLAPCTHSDACPLLVHSQKDWCHNRVHFAPPQWFCEIENHLPMKNRTLTFSYLLMSRTVKDTVWRGASRIIGDTLEDNGKNRQLICRGSQREFLSWLHKAGPPPQIPRGALVRGVELAVKKGDELRPAADSLSWDV